MQSWERHIEELSNMYGGECNAHRAKHGLEPSDTCEGLCTCDCPLLKDEEVR